MNIIYFRIFSCRVECQVFPLLPQFTLCLLAAKDLCSDKRNRRLNENKPQQRQNNCVNTASKRTRVILWSTGNLQKG